MARVIPSSIRIPQSGWVKPRQPGAAEASGLRPAVLVLSAFLIGLAVIAIGGVGYALLTGEAIEYANTVTQREDVDKALVQIPKSIDCIPPALDRLAEKLGSHPAGAKAASNRASVSGGERRDPAAVAMPCGNAPASNRSR